ncbi:MAG: protein kinase [Archangiaceae bacterium]|nr:protein kinase [Archangiaceae bacterium]
MTPCQHCGSPHPPGTPNCPRTGDSMTQPGPIGQRLDRYQVESLLGAGGFGSVFRARHVHTDSVVALKVLKAQLGADPQMVERFLREARAAAAVGSDHIVRVLDAGQGPDGTPFLALELLEGVDLKELAVQQAPLPPMRVVLLCLQVLDGLEAAHKKGIVHRDMKPANAFVVRKVDDRGTDKDFVKLLDFGISKMHSEGGSGLTMTGVAMGTPSYMAPEQFFDARSVDARADVYSVAVMMYELLSGRLPLDAESYAGLIVKVRTEQPPHLSLVAANVPKPLADAVMVGLAKEKEQRWGSAKEFGNALRGAMGLPLPGNTPIPPRATMGAHKPQPPLEVDSMLTGKTAVPQRATPMPEARPSTPPPPAARQPTPQPVQPARVQPTPVNPTPAAPASNVPVPSVPVTPAQQQGWVVPGPTGQTPQQQTPVGMASQYQSPVGMAPQYQAPPPQAPSSGSSTLKWVAIIGGGLVGLCCMCLGIGSMSDSFQSKKDEPPAVEQPVVDAQKVLDDLKVPVPPKGSAPAANGEQLDPNGHEIYDSLKLDPKPDPDETIDDADLTDEDFNDLPSKEELVTVATAAGFDPNAPKVKKAIAAVDRIRQIQKLRKNGKLTSAQKSEIIKLTKDITEVLPQ